MEQRSFTSYGFHHGDHAWVDVNLTGAEPILSVKDRGAILHISPSATGAGDDPLSDEHVRFARELARGAQVYADAIEGARFWADFDQAPSDAEGAV
jgi:hypothetical protein